jgi:D-alanine transaminase
MLLAVATLDEGLVGSGKPGPVFRKIHPLYQDFKRRVMRQAA